MANGMTWVANGRIQCGWGGRQANDAVDACFLPAAQTSGRFCFRRLRRGAGWGFFVTTLVTVWFSRTSATLPSPVVVAGVAELADAYRSAAFAYREMLWGILHPSFRDFSSSRGAVGHTS